MQIKIKKFNKDAIIPQFATEGAACVDVVAIDMIRGDGLVTYKLGFGVELPVGYKFCIAPRSSFTHKSWIMANSPAQIDSDYRGEIIIKFQAIPSYYSGDIHQVDYPYRVGDRVAQMWLEKVIDFKFEEVEELESTQRGEGGFGSTGK